MIDDLLQLEDSEKAHRVRIPARCDDFDEGEWAHTFFFGLKLQGIVIFSAVLNFF